MNRQTVGMLSPGEMGHAIGAVLHQHQMRVITNLQGRSARTPEMPEGASSLYGFVEGTVLGAETPEQRQHGQTLEEVISLLASALIDRLPEDRTTL